MIERIRKGDEYAFELAFLKYYTPLCNYIWKYVRSRDLSEEVIQEVFAAVWETRKALNPNGHLRGFLYEAARNRALNYIKHQKNTERFLSEIRQNRREEASLPPNHVDIHDQDLLHAAGEVIDHLPPKARRIYKLNRQEGLTYYEIATFLGISVKTVEYQMAKALQILRECLSKYLPVFIMVFWSWWLVVGGG